MGRDYKEQLRSDYLLLNFAKKMRAMEGVNWEKLENYIKNLTIDLRKKERWHEESILSNPDWKYSDDGYGPRRYYKEVVDEYYTDEDMIEYKKENWQNWYNPWEDGRDCTGVWFTTRIEFHRVRSINKTFIYHYQIMDV